MQFPKRSFASFTGIVLKDTTDDFFGATSIDDLAQLVLLNLTTDYGCYQIFAFISFVLFRILFLLSLGVEQTHVMEISRR